MNAVGILLLVLLIGIVLVAPRRWAVLGFIGGVLYLTEGQQWNVAGFNIFAVRILEVAGFLRVSARHEWPFRRLTAIDRALLYFYGFSTLVFLLRSTEGQAYQIGLAVDACLSYFTFRGLIHDSNDLRWFLKGFILLLAPYVCLLAIERISTQNPFAFMGGVATESWFREGKVRCCGSFRHPSLLGTLGACWAPLYVALAFDKKYRSVAVVGIGLCLAIIVFSNSGGPVGALLAGVVALLLWPLREKMYLVRRALVIGLCLLALVMKAPVWYVIMHFSDIVGGDGWHRAYLIDMAVKHIDRWWFVGMPIEGTHDWFPYNLPGTESSDITNQFVSLGIKAGLGAIVLFVVVLTRAFSNIGKALKSVRLVGGDNATEALFWALGAVLTSHIVNWLGITYFDQTYVIWFMQLAAISSLTGIALNRAASMEAFERRLILDLEPEFSGSPQEACHRYRS